MDGPALSTPPLRPTMPTHLVEKIRQSKPALEGERKVISVLFADVKGSVELAGQMDPEEWSGIMERFFRLLSDGVERFEGFVDKFTGDGIMALFGAPIAQEDHAQRACYAALHIGEALRPYANELRLRKGLNFSVRMGINSGEVVVGKIGDDLRMAYTAQGQTVGLAARMEQIAEAGKVYLTEYAAALVQGFFQLSDLGQLDIKGVQQPLRVYELQGVGQLRTRLDVSRTRGFSRFVGRIEEMHVLESALSRAEAGYPQIVGIVGEAGLGKSRLCFEFLERCRTRGLMTYEAQGIAHGKSVPFLPILRLFRSFYGIADQDSDATAREKIAGRLLLLEEGLRDALPLVFEFIGCADPERPAPRIDPEARQRQLFALTKRVVRARGRSETTVTLLEDLHWFDGGSDGFLEQLLDLPPGNRALVVVNFRPEYRAEWTRKSYYQQLALQPLDSDAIRQLIADLLGSDPTTDGLATVIHRRTAGNPFFAEEVLQSLIESGRLVGGRGNYRLVGAIDDLQVPGSVQALLAARIDRLVERDKQVLQVAAVIGKTFVATVLERVLSAVGPPDGVPASESLHRLKRGEFLFEQSLYPVAEYAFKHPVTQEVAYHSLLQERRARVHAAIAQAIEAANVDKLDEHAALLAHHWQAAGEPILAARWHARAAARVGTSDSVQALSHWRKVVDLLRQVPESQETAALAVGGCLQVLQLGWRTGLSEGDSAQQFAHGRAIAERSGNAPLLAGLLSSYGGVRGLVEGDVADCVKYNGEAAQVAERTEDTALKASVAVGLAYALLLAGRISESVAVCEQAQRIAPNDSRLRFGFTNYDPCIWHVQHRGSLYQVGGALTEATEHYERALRLAREAQDIENQLFTHTICTSQAYYTGDAVSGMMHARRALELVDAAGSSSSQVALHISMALVHMINREWDAALEAQHEALRIFRDTRAGRVWQPQLLAQLSEAHLGRGDGARALAYAEEALSDSRRCGTVIYDPIALIARARALLRVKGPAARIAIDDDLAQALTVVEQSGLGVHVPFIYAARAELAAALDDHAVHQHALAEAHRLFVAIGAPARAEQLAGELARTAP
jgi:class 3 adenylate cyclase/tetratricopeptide (TPR) repeat protein